MEIKKLTSALSLKRSVDAGTADQRRVVQDIISTVCEKGDEAIRDYTEKFDGVRLEDFAVSEEELNEAFSAMDGAPVLALEISQNKAFSAAAYNRATHEWYDRLKDDPPLMTGLVHTKRLVVFGGGYPIHVNGECVGGIGVSGGHYTHDMQVCEAGLSVVEAVKEV